jgi:hypothetical protein
MKNIYKLSVGIILVAVVGLSSCVKNTVSDEVKQLRQSQVALLNAQVEEILANASSTNVNSRYTRMNIYFDSLFNVVELTSEQNNAAYNKQVQDSQLVQALLHIQNQVTIEQSILKQNQLNLAQATAEYERFIAQGQFQQNVSDLLGKYSHEAMILNQLYDQRILNKQQIAEQQLLLTTNNWDIVKTRYEDRITDLTAKLAAQNAALTALEGVLADPATLETEKLALNTEIATLNDSLDLLDTQHQEAANTYQDAQKLVTHANFVINIMDNSDTYNIGPAYEDGYLNDLVEANADLATLNASLVTENATLALLNATLASAQTSLTAATAAYNAKLALYNTAVTNQNNAQNNIDAKYVLLQVATNNYNAGLVAIPALSPAALTALEAAVTNAQAAYDAAVTVRDDPEGTTAKLGVATTALSDANTTMLDAQSAVTTAQNNVDSQTTTIAGTNSSIDSVTDYITVITAKIAQWQTEYDNAKANLNTYIVDADLKSKVQILISIQIGKVESMVSELTSVVTTLTSHIDDIASTIIAQKLAIGATENSIATLQGQIQSGEIDKAFIEDQIAKFEAVLADTEIRITNSEAIVAVWKKMLDEAIAAQN